MAQRKRKETLGRLYVLYHDTNERYFGGLLPLVPIYFAPNLKPGKTETTAYLWTDDYEGVPRYIVVREEHALQDPWPSVQDTLLHELIHVWQASRGHKVNHGPTFKKMAARLGVAATATAPAPAE